LPNNITVAQIQEKKEELKKKSRYNDLFLETAPLTPLKQY
jgi:hypothetical protein